MCKFTKWMRVALIAVLCLSLSLLFVACNPDDGKGTGGSGGTSGAGGATQKYSAFFYNQTTLVATVETEFDKTVSAPSSLAKTGYVFKGWFEDNQTFTVPFDSSKSYNKDVSFYAKWNASQYTVTFDANGGMVADQELTAIYDANFTLPTPTRTGYTFDGWYDSQDKEYTSGVWTTAGNVTLVAKWNVEYTITLDANGGVCNQDEILLNYGSEFSLPTPTRTGYTFDGWYDCQCNEYTSGTWNTNSDTTLTAKWIAKTYTVTFDANDGIVDDQELTATYDANFTLPTPMRTGYEFDGWYDTDNSKYTSGVWDTDKNIALTAKWNAAQYTVTFDANGGTVDDEELTVTYDANFTLPTPMRTGYELDGWYDSQDNEYTSGIWTTASNMTLVAKWTANTYEITYLDIKNDIVTVTFDYNYSGANTTEVVLDEPGEILQIPTVPERSGYIFRGWFKDATCDYTQWYDFSGDITSDMTLYAGWQKINVTSYNKIYQIDPSQYDSQSSYYFVNNNNTSYGKPNYIYFVAKTSSSKGIKWANGTTGSNYNNWIKISNITANVNGSIDLVDSTSYSSMSTGYRAGDVVLITTYRDKSNYSPTLRLYFSNFEEITSYASTNATGNFVYSRGSRIVDTVVYGEDITLIKPVHPSYVFDGWYDDEDNQYVSGAWTTERGVTLVAKWAVKEFDVVFNDVVNDIMGAEITVTFDYNYAGSNPNQVTLHYEEKLDYPAVPTRSGFAFAGWCTNSECTTQYTFSGDITQDMTLYAKWVKMPSTSLSLNEAYSTEYVDVVNYNNSSSKKTMTISSPNSSCPDYYYFTCLEDGKYTFYSEHTAGDFYITVYNTTKHSYIINEVNLWIYYKQKSVSFTADAGDVIYVSLYQSGSSGTSKGAFYVSGASYPSSTAVVDNCQYVVDSTYTDSVTYGKDYTLPTPTRTGYTFDGWFDANGKQYTSGIWTTDSNVSLIAKWFANTYTVTFDANGGTCDEDEITFTYDSAATLPIPTRTGYTFDGWLDVNSKQYTSGTWATDSDVTLIAKWVANAYTVTFNVNGGSCDTSEMTVVFDDDVVLPTPTTTQTGYEFGGWFDNKGNEYLSGTWKTDANVNLITKWVCKQYDITLRDIESGKEEYVIWFYNYYPDESVQADRTKEVIVKSGERLLVPANPTRNDGFVFEGWYLDLDYTTEYMFNDYISEDLVLFAHWVRPASTNELSWNGKKGSWQVISEVAGNLIPSAFDTFSYTAPAHMEISLSYQLKMDGVNRSRLQIIANGYVYVDANTNRSGSMAVELQKGEILKFNYTQQDGSDRVDITNIEFTPLVSYQSSAFACKSTDFIYSSGSTSVIKATYDSQLTLPTPFRSGYRFDGWFDSEGNPYTDCLWTKDEGAELFAKWTEVAQGSE